ncbi:MULTISPECIES: hypothetical protein [Providencia]|uniref:hypothetical protein n=1 Tax=Providencia TaxID=586 RepID=UPI000B092E9D|nr:hypothetical protein [Providencia heimbachae]MBP6121982.1 hypothetical protein [Providencia sp.]MDD9338683.1 hypothetical protein [Providencia heimbachae]NIH21528.1 hypothetical protein [Providencia heimbachae]
MAEYPPIFLPKRIIKAQYWLVFATVLTAINTIINRLFIVLSTLFPTRKPFRNYPLFHEEGRSLHTWHDTGMPKIK